MKLLIIHQNFPAQYFNIARHYAAAKGCQVMVVTEADNQGVASVPGITVCAYARPPEPAGGLLALTYERQVRRGYCVAAALKGIKERGFEPDVILVHSAWGEGLFIRTVFRHTPIMAYAETYARPDDLLLNFDPEFPFDEGLKPVVLAQNAGSALLLAEADCIQTPTLFQMQQLPPVFRDRAVLLYDGVDCDLAVPNPQASLTLPPTESMVGADFAPLPAFAPPRREPLRLNAGDEVITFVCRTLEPYVGWHNFVRALALIQERFPRVQCVVVGRTSGGYGPPPPQGHNWRDLFLAEQRMRLDFSRLHLAVNLPRQAVLNLLAITRAHVYLPYPFWLSYSPIEAMSCGAPLVAAATGPVLELVEDQTNGLLVDFHDPEAIAHAVGRLLENPDLRSFLGAAGRRKVLESYDLKRVWLSRWQAVIENLAQRKYAKK